MDSSDNETPKPTILRECSHDREATGVSTPKQVTPFGIFILLLVTKKFSSKTPERLLRVLKPLARRHWRASNNHVLHLHIHAGGLRPTSTDVRI